ncbi:MAG: 30S ribosomal protein S2 [Candidatus Pacebacteria bacterium]|nr:30S ribosomal protein S2 [Candidatus Paceibacterota bacterium]
MEETKTENKYKITMEEMIQVGLGYGHEKSKLNPKMKDYVLKQKDKVFIIDLDKTAEKLEQALDFVSQLRKEGKIVLFVGTKVAMRDLVKKTAEESKSPYVVDRWIGGTFTNFKELRKRIEYFKDLEAKTKEIEFEKKYVKKERIKMMKEIERLKIKFDGIKNMEQLPSAIFIVDVEEDKIALKEAIQSKVPVIAIADTNVDPTKISFPIPGNDDAYTSVEYVLYKIQEALKGE